MTNQQIKPFTLEWWMRMLGNSNSKAIFESWDYLTKKGRKHKQESFSKYNRYYNLSCWIENRIIQKYGESKTDNN